MKKRISIIGLGKLGAPMLAVFSSRGYKVIGVDVNQSVVDTTSITKNRGSVKLLVFPRNIPQESFVHNEYISPHKSCESTSSS